MDKSTLLPVMLVTPGWQLGTVKGMLAGPLSELFARVKAMGVPHTYEEFPDDHSSVDYRMDVSLPILAKALAG